MSYALGNVNLFYPPADIVAGKAPVDRAIRVGGMVVEGSILRSEQDLTTVFEVTDYARYRYRVHRHSSRSVCEGRRCCVGHAVTGRELSRDQVLAKHDENYMPPESLKRYRAPSPQTRRTGRGGD